MGWVLGWSCWLGLVEWVVSLDPGQQHRAGRPRADVVRVMRRSSEGGRVGGFSQQSLLPLEVVGSGRFFR